MHRLRNYSTNNAYETIQIMWNITNILVSMVNFMISIDAGFVVRADYVFVWSQWLIKGE